MSEHEIWLRCMVEAPDRETAEETLLRELEEFGGVVYPAWYPEAITWEVVERAIDAYMECGGDLVKPLPMKHALATALKAFMSEGK